MMTIAKTFEWDMGHRVPNHDSLCKNPHGHRYVMHVHVSGDMNMIEGNPAQGMVVDFSKLKKLIMKEIIDKLDHSFMYYERDEIMRTFASANPSLRMHKVPFIPTAEEMAEDISKKLMMLLHKQMPGLSLERVELFETPKSKAIWTKDA